MDNRIKLNRQLHQIQQVRGMNLSIPLLDIHTLQHIIHKLT
jgi:hypothetical protein